MSNPVRLRQSQTPRASAGAFPVSRPSLRCHPKRQDRDAKKTRPARTGARNRLQAQITLRPVADLIPYVNNPRTHSDEQVAVIAGSIREFGWTNPVDKLVADLDAKLATMEFAETDVALHVDQLVVGHSGFGQKHIHVPGH